MVMEDKEVLLKLVDKIWSAQERPDGALDPKFEDLVCYLDALIRDDFNRLLAILYRVDVAEEKVRTRLAEDNGNHSAGYVIACLLVERELEKIAIRARYKPKGI